LPPIGSALFGRRFARADDAALVVRDFSVGDEDFDAIDKAGCLNARFAIVEPIVNVLQNRQFENADRAFERDAVLSDIRLVLGRIP
jgi:hypothetical protein